MRTLVLNPNSSTRVTEAVRAAVSQSPLAASAEVAMLPDAPASLDTPEKVALVQGMVEGHLAQAASQGATDVIVACHGDPGVDSWSGPGRALGIGRTSLLVAAALGPFGILTLSEALVPRKIAQAQSHGVAARLAGVVSVNQDAEHFERTGDVSPYITAVESLLANRADVVVLGCAGLVGLKGHLHQRFPNLLVIEPVATTIQVLSMGTHNTGQ